MERENDGCEVQDLKHELCLKLLAVMEKVMECKGYVPQPELMPKEGQKRVRAKKDGQLRGVTQHRRTTRWEAHIWEMRRQIYLGGYLEEHKAAKAHDILAIRCRGPDTVLNYTLVTYTALVPLLPRFSKIVVLEILLVYSRDHLRGAAPIIREHDFKHVPFQNPFRDIDAKPMEVASTSNARVVRPSLRPRKSGTRSPPRPKPAPGRAPQDMMDAAEQLAALVAGQPMNARTDPSKQKQGVTAGADAIRPRPPSVPNLLTQPTGPNLLIKTDAVSGVIKGGPGKPVEAAKPIAVATMVVKPTATTLKPAMTTAMPMATIAKAVTTVAKPAATAVVTEASVLPKRVSKPPRRRTPSDSDDDQRGKPRCRRATDAAEQNRNTEQTRHYPSPSPAAYTHGVDAGAHTHGVDAGARTHGMDAGARTHGMDAGARTHGMDAGVRTHGMDGGERTHGMDAKARTHGMDAGHNSRAGQSRRRVVPGHSAHQNKEGPRLQYKPQKSVGPAAPHSANHSLANTFNHIAALFKLHLAAQQSMPQAAGGVAATHPPEQLSEQPSQHHQSSEQLSQLPAQPHQFPGQLSQLQAQRHQYPGQLSQLQVQQHQFPGQQHYTQQPGFPNKLSQKAPALLTPPPTQLPGHDRLRELAHKAVDELRANGRADDSHDEVQEGSQRPQQQEPERRSSKRLQGRGKTRLLQQQDGTEEADVHALLHLRGGGTKQPRKCDNEVFEQCDLTHDTDVDDEDDTLYPVVLPDMPVYGYVWAKIGEQGGWFPIYQDCPSEGC